MSLEFNIKNEDTDFQIFFGEPHGLFDSFNVKYPQIETADDEQQSLFWKAKEISMVQDSKDLLSIDENIREIFIKALSFQMAADSFASGSIAELFLPICTNPQLESLIAYWNLTEATHAKSYGNIIATVFKDPNELLERIRNDEVMISRLGFILESFGLHNQMLNKIRSGGIVQLSEKRKTTIKTITSLLALEGIMFLSSFASTFAVCEATQKLNGIGKEVGLIFNDEVMHTKNNIILLNIIKNEWEEWHEVKHEVKEILDSTIKAEEHWASELFNNTGDIIGFNPNLLSDYTKYLALPIYNQLEIEFNFKKVTENPLTWIDSYINPDLLQVANQEAQNNNYLTGTSIDDTDDCEFHY